MVHVVLTAVRTACINFSFFPYSPPLPQHSLPPSAYATVKAYSNFDADRDAAALEAAIKTKGEDHGLWV